MQLSTLLHVFAFFLSLGAFVQLKFRCRGVERLWAVPAGKFGALVVVFVQLPFLVLLLISACTDIAVIWGALVGNLVVVLLHFAWMRRSRRSEPISVCLID